jgi:hypothetical protein
MPDSPSDDFHPVSASDTLEGSATQKHALRAYRRDPTYYCRDIVILVRALIHLCLEKQRSYSHPRWKTCYSEYREGYSSNRRRSRTCSASRLPTMPS